MDLGSGLGHLTYSTLVHPGDTWAQMFESLQTYLPRVKARICPKDPFGVSLRLSAKSAQTLVDSASERDRLKRFLGEGGMYLYTANAFPYGDFKAGPVKEQVYEPDWRTEQRTQYTKNVATVLAELAPPGISPSIQSAPLGFKPNVKGPQDVASFTEHVLQVTAHLVKLAGNTGRVVTLALEPEPMCFLETTDEAVRYFLDHLYTGASAERLARLAGIPVSEALVALRQHVGVVFDICHQAIEYEDIPASLQSLVDAGIPIFKLQEAAAVHIPQVDQRAVDALTRFAETVYLTQTLQRKDGKITRFLNLEDAFAAWSQDKGPREWRVHFHVPVFLDDLGPFRTTRFAIEQALAFHKRTPLSRQLEIETYTWDVLPDHLKTGDIVDYVCREIEWVRGQLM
jgi:hypothetical protein